MPTAVHRRESLIALTVDVEFGRGDVERETEWLLDLFGEFAVKATFFVLGEVARALPHLVSRITTEGHDVGFHGASHLFLSELGPQSFERELRKWLPFLEDLVQHPVEGYRAPFFSLCPGTAWALPALVSAGVTYDGSIYPGWHDRYGWLGAPQIPSRFRETSLVLFPVPLLHPCIPFAFSGGGYLRLLPWAMIRWGFHRHILRDRAGMVYIHPWEVSTESPIRPGISRRGRFTHVPGWRQVRPRLRKLLEAHHDRCRPMRAVIEAQKDLPIWNPCGASAHW